MGAFRGKGNLFPLEVQEGFVEGIICAEFYYMEIGKGGRSRPGGECSENTVSRRGKQMIWHAWRRGCDQERKRREHVKVRPESVGLEILGSVSYTSRVHGHSGFESCFCPFFTTVTLGLFLRISALQFPGL